MARSLNAAGQTLMAIWLYHWSFAASPDQHHMDHVHVACDENVLSSSIPQWDTKGYIMYCPCMGNFGNQVEYLIGTLAFAKAIDRTLVVPPFRVKKNIPFSTWFQVNELREFHRIITMENFMALFGADRWPAGQRVGYCSLERTSNLTCNMKQGNPLGPFWDDLNIDFDDHVKYSIITNVDVTDQEGVNAVKDIWNRTFLPSEHPVIVFRFPPSTFPVRAGNREIQRYIKWNYQTFVHAEEEISRLFYGERYLGIHLRTGPDWVSACANTIGSLQVMASPQCLSREERVFMEMCYPTAVQVVNQTKEAVLKHMVQHVYIATDKLSYSKELEEALSPLGVKVHHLDPYLPQVDLMILGQADFFIGNCISSFTSFVKRERDVSGKLSTFWGFPV